MATPPTPPQRDEQKDSTRLKHTQPHLPHPDVPHLPTPQASTAGRLKTVTQTHQCTCTPGNPTNHHLQSSWLRQHITHTHQTSLNTPRTTCTDTTARYPVSAHNPQACNKQSQTNMPEITRHSRSAAATTPLSTRVPSAINTSSASSQLAHTLGRYRYHKPCQ